MDCSKPTGGKIACHCSHRSKPGVVLRGILQAHSGVDSSLPQSTESIPTAQCRDSYRRPFRITELNSEVIRDGLVGFSRTGRWIIVIAGGEDCVPTRS